MKKGFTLIELIIVLAIIAVLVAILIAVLKPGQMFARLRDTQRTADLNTIGKAIDVYLADLAQNPSAITMTASGTLVRPTSSLTYSITISDPLGGCVGGATPTIFYSAADPTSGGTGNITGPGGDFKAVRATTSRAVDGTGWVPIPFTSSGIINLTALPIDPRNGPTITSVPSYYYTYACKTDFSYELDARLEINTSTALNSNDGGDINFLYEVGSNKNLLPNATSALFYPY
jgi:prepilin-type N-terminal cleavage/methylation domain-containing protein